VRSGAGFRLPEHEERDGDKAAAQEALSSANLKNLNK
jgi:hypothetical protein